jgi:hypothetical protein
MTEKKIATTVYLTEDQIEKLRTLSDYTKVPMAEYIRQGIDMSLEKNGDSIPGQLSLLDIDGFFASKGFFQKEF